MKKHTLLGRYQAVLQTQGRPTEKETLISRLIDRPLRPLFASTYNQEVQIILTLVSLNPEIDPEIPALIAASTVVKLAGLPFNGTLGAVKVGFENDQYILNPTSTQLATSKLDLTVAGTSNAVLMVESEASELNEDLMLGAVLFGHKSMQIVIDKIKEFKELVGVEDWVVEKDEETPRYLLNLNQIFHQRLKKHSQLTKKSDRSEAINAVRLEILEKYEDLDELATGKVMSAFKKT